MERYQDYTYKNAFFVKRWLHERRYRDTLRFLKLRAHDILLDYGCGDGYFLRMCSEKIPAEHLVGYEPDPDMYHEAAHVTRGTGITIVRTIDALHSGAFTKITCLETGEHLVDKELDALLVNIERLLAQRGRMVLSVPIETGVPALLKNTFRILKGHMPDNLTFLNFWRMVFGFSIPRSTPEHYEHGQYIYSHMGFNHRQFEEVLKQHMRIENKHYSPLSVMNAVFSNTVLYACVHR